MITLQHPGSQGMSLSLALQRIAVDDQQILQIQIYTSTYYLRIVRVVFCHGSFPNAVKLKSLFVVSAQLGAGREVSLATGTTRRCMLMMSLVPYDIVQLDTMRRRRIGIDTYDTKQYGQ